MAEQAYFRAEYNPADENGLAILGVTDTEEEALNELGY
jgi:hypothetical protein